MSSPPEHQDLDLTQFKALDALLVGNTYDDATLSAMLPYVNLARKAAHQLRAMALGEVHSAVVMLAGGQR